MAETTYFGVGIYPGIAQVRAASYTATRGITPSTVEVELAPQVASPLQGGDFIFNFGPVGTLSPIVVLKSCRIKTGTIQRTRQNLIARIGLEDRRWKWVTGTGVNGPLSGTYNIRLDDGTLDPYFKRAPQDLAVLCLQAMGELSYDVSQLPNYSYPPVYWDRDNPARALQNLADQLGCIVCYNPLNDSVSICQTGLGATLPALDAMEDSLSLSLPERPDALAVVGGKSRYQNDWTLEAVGKDVDGSIKLINNLSYAPAGGWAFETPNFFSSVPTLPAANGQSPRECAKESVWRWYRIKMPQKLPGYGSDFSQLPNLTNVAGNTINSLRQILPIEDEQVATYTEIVDVPGADKPGKIRNLPAWVYGTYYSGDFGFINTPPLTPYTKSFSVDKDRGIVMFSDAVLQYDAVNGYTPATVFMRCAVSVRDPYTFAWDKFQVQVNYANGNWGTGARVLKHDELVFQTIPVLFSPNAPFDALTVLTNGVQMVSESNYYLQAADLEYQLPAAQNRLYPGIIGISPDGAIAQVTWSVGPQGATTRVARSNEVHFAIPPYRERMMYEELRSDQLNAVKGLVQKLAFSKATDRVLRDGR